MEVIKAQEDLVHCEKYSLRPVRRLQTGGQYDIFLILAMLATLTALETT